MLHQLYTADNILKKLDPVVLFFSHEYLIEPDHAEGQQNLIRMVKIVFSVLKISLQFNIVWEFRNKLKYSGPYDATVIPITVVTTVFTMLQISFRFKIFEREAPWSCFPHSLCLAVIDVVEFEIFDDWDESPAIHQYVQLEQ